MNLVDAIAMLAVVQYLTFGGLAGRARGKYGVEAPAITGDPMFERIYRVQMNTLELLVALLPVMYAAVHYLPPNVVAVAGFIYLVGRIVYWRAYVNQPNRRGLGFFLSIGPVYTLALATLVGALRSVSVA